MAWYEDRDRRGSESGPCCTLDGQNTLAYLRNEVLRFRGNLLVRRPRNDSICVRLDEIRFLAIVIQHNVKVRRAGAYLKHDRTGAIGSNRVSPGILSANGASVYAQCIGAGQRAIPVGDKPAHPAENTQIRTVKEPRLRVSIRAIQGSVRTSIVSMDFERRGNPPSPNHDRNSSD